MPRKPSIVIGSDGSMCRRCGKLFESYLEALNHVALEHAKKKPKRKSKPGKETLRHPTAAERKDIRAAIREAKQNNL